MAPTTTKPQILLVPGAWHGPSAFAPTTRLLEAAGYTVHGIELASVTWSDAGKPAPSGSEDDSAIIRTKLEDLVDNQGLSVVVLCHSYGGMAVMPALRGFSQRERSAAGKKGGVTFLIYCCAFALPNGVSLMDALNNTPLPWFDVSDDQTSVNAMTPRDIFYNDLSEAEAEQYIAHLKPFAYKAMSTKNTFQPWEEIDCGYIVCEKDQAIPAGAQRGMVQGVEAGGGKMKVWELDASHSPFLSMPEKVAEIVREAAGEVVTV